MTYQFHNAPVSLVFTFAGLGFILLAMHNPRSQVWKRAERLLPGNPAPIIKSNEALVWGPKILAFLGPSRAELAITEWLARNLHLEVVTLARLLAITRSIMVFVTTALVSGMLWFWMPGRLPSFVILPLGGIIGVPLGLYFTHKLIKNQEERRRRYVARDLPNAMDLLLICLGSGVGLQTAIDRIADELAAISPDVAEELVAVNADLAVLGDYDHAFEKLAKRIPVANITSLVTIIRDSLKHGSPIRSALQTAVDMDRQRSLILIDQLSNEVPAKITAMTMCFCFPPLLIVIGAPPILSMVSVITK